MAEVELGKKAKGEAKAREGARVAVHSGVGKRSQSAHSPRRYH